jgi:hypothetical protein
MRPRFGPAIASRSADATAGPSRWTHRVGVSWQHEPTLTPTRNAIGLSLPVALAARSPIGSLSPWHSFLPPRAHRVEDAPPARRCCRPSMQGEGKPRPGPPRRMLGPCRVDQFQVRRRAEPDSRGTSTGMTAMSLSSCVTRIGKILVSRFRSSPVFEARLRSELRNHKGH